MGAMVGISFAENVVIRGSSAVPGPMTLLYGNGFYGYFESYGTKKIAIDTCYVVVFNCIDNFSVNRLMYSTYQTIPYEEVFVRNSNFMEGFPVPKGVFWASANFESVTLDNIKEVFSNLLINPYSFDGEVVVIP